MPEVSYYSEPVFDITIDAGSYFAVYDFSCDDEHEPFFDEQFRVGQEMEGFLRLIYGDHVSVQDRFASADFWGLETNELVFSDTLIKHVSGFLRDNCRDHSVIIVLYDDMMKGETYLGRAIVSLKRIGVELQIKEMFEERCKDSLRDAGSKFIFDETC